jgi:hypothetical protein
LKERALFLARSGEAFRALCDRARGLGKCLTYRLDDVRGLIEKHFERGSCPYCRCPLTAAAFVLDHKLPLARGGKLTFKNLDVSCRRCHGLKGVLDSQEFRDLVALVSGWPKPVQRQFLSRLWAGSDIVPLSLPRLDSLEWFTADPHAFPTNGRVP